MDPGMSAGASSRDADHPRVLLQFPRQLVRCDVHGVHACGAALEQAIRETSRRGADVQANTASRIDPEFLKRAFQLQSAAACVFLQPRVDLNPSVLRNQLSPLLRARPVNLHLARKDHGLRFLS